MRQYKMLANIKYARERYLMLGEVYDLDDPSLDHETLTVLNNLVTSGSKLVTLHKGQGVHTFDPHEYGVSPLQSHTGVATTSPYVPEPEGEEIMAPLKPKK